MDFITTKGNDRTPVQDQILTLIQAEPRSKEEICTLLDITRGNLSRYIQGLISKGKIRPNPQTKKYEINSPFSSSV